MRKLLSDMATRDEELTLTFGGRCSFSIGEVQRYASSIVLALTGPSSQSARLQRSSTALTSCVCRKAIERKQENGEFYDEDRTDIRWRLVKLFKLQYTTVGWGSGI